MARAYTPRDIDLSRAIYKFLRGEGGALEVGFLTYKEVGDNLGVFHRTIRGALYYIQDRCNERGWPTLTVWVVRKDSGLPGFGCDVVAPDEVRQTADATRKIDWPKEAWW